MPPPLVLVERHGAVAQVSLNRPERRNALNDEMIRELGTALAEVTRDPSCRAVVLTGSGSAFCAGGDIAANGNADAATAITRHDRFVEVALRLHRLPKPTVSAINGPAIGAGLSLALLCDEVVVARTARLAFSFLQTGLPPDLMSAATVQRRAGWTVAADLFHTGRVIPPDEALALRLVNEVVAGEVLPPALERARHLAELSPAAFLATKQLLRSAWSSLEAVAQAEPGWVATCVATEEFRETVKRFGGSE
jgi:2-(1,2-epoxy-1,2-dihydrophenyl)acetyl-CoA isomerase